MAQKNIANNTILPSNKSIFDIVMLANSTGGVINSFGGGGGGGGGSTSFQVTPLIYKASTNGTGYSNNDIIVQIDEYDTTVTPPTFLSTIWRNATQGTTLGTPPTLSNLFLVTDLSLPLPTGNNVIGSVNIPNALPTGNNHIGRTISEAVYTASPLSLTDGQTIPLQVDSDGSLVVNVRDLTTDGQVVTNSTLVTTPNTMLFNINTLNYNSVAIQFGGIWTGTVVLRSSNDGVTWYPAYALPASYDIQVTDTIQNNDLIIVGVRGKFLAAFTNSDFFADPATTGAGINYSYVLRNSGSEFQPQISITTDPGTSIPVAGVGPDGITRRLNTDVTGSVKLSDKSVPYYGATNFVNGVVAIIDTSGYNSVLVQLFGTWVGTVSFQISNDATSWQTISGYASTNAIAVSSTTANGIWLIPAMGKYFRAYCSAYTSGNIQGITFLSSQMVPSLTNNLGFVAGTATVTAGLAGMLAVGGNIAAGVAPTANPVLVGGIDTSGLTRRILTTNTGAVSTVSSVTGIDQTATVRTLATDTLSRLQVSNINDVVPQGTLDGNTETLNEILWELKQLNFILKEIPLYLNQGLVITDSSSSFRDDVTNITI